VRANNLKSYKMLEHQHVPEIEQTLADAGADRRSSSCASSRCRRR
jgi:N-acetyl-gamma-glutamylphosphate reductase